MGWLDETVGSREWDYGYFSELSHNYGYAGRRWVLHKWVFNSPGQTTPPTDEQVRYVINRLQERYSDLTDLVYQLYEQIPGDYRLSVRFHVPRKER